MLGLALVLAAALALPLTAAAEITLPPGFAKTVYVTGEGFDTAEGRGGVGIPSAATLAVDASGVLYIARTGRRYSGGEVDDLWPVYRIPVGGAKVTKATEKRFLYGPPLPSAQIAGLRGGRELLVTTFDRDRKVGVLYMLVNGHAELMAGGTPPRGASPVLVQPEGVAVDAEGRLYVADRAQDRVLMLDARGAVVDPARFTVKRPRSLAIGADKALWIAGDGAAEAPWQRGPGEIWRHAGEGEPTLMLRGPVAAGMDVGPAGSLFVADRQASTIFVLGPDGRSVPFARFSDGDAPRGLVFAPVTAETQRAGIAGDLFLISIHRGAWPINEVVRISGPFEQYLRESLPAR
jgi:DNA-binding beta-propeller fold protein YncE